VYARFRYNVYGALRMLAAHERRHLWQIERILKTLDRAPIRAS
jgi:rubrerythrin